MENGADPGLKTQQNKTAWDVATQDPQVLGALCDGKTTHAKCESYLAGKSVASDAVASTPHRLDPIRQAPKFFPDTVNVNVHGPVRNNDLPVVDPIQNLVPAQNHPRAFTE